MTRSCQQFKKYVTMPEKLLHNDYIYIDTLFAAKIIVPNQDNPIAAGKLDGDIVECPSHFWHYNIKTGELQDYLKGVKLETYPVEERNDGPQSAWQP